MAEMVTEPLQRYEKSGAKSGVGDAEQPLLLSENVISLHVSALCKGGGGGGVTAVICSLARCELLVFFTLAEETHHSFSSLRI